MKIILSAFVILFSSISFGQNDLLNTPEKLWAKVNSESYNKLLDSLNTYYDETRNDIKLHDSIKKEELKSLAICDQLIQEFPGSDLVFDAMYRKALITYEYLNIDIAQEFFFKVVNFNTTKTAYKRKAYRFLASIEIDKSNYNQAILYLDESSKYKVTYFCGNEWDTDTRQLRNMYTICFDGLCEKR
ncbi:hypothetical protein [Flavobacterium magnum]|nr:hypothetical protein [Flavobacterium magnum]